MAIVITALITALALVAVFGLLLWLKKIVPGGGANSAKSENAMRSQLTTLAQEVLSGASEQLLTLADEKLGQKLETSSKELEGKKQLIDLQVKAVSEELRRVHKVVTDYEKDRESKFGEITTQIKQMGEQTTALNSTTTGLRDVLRGPQSRGQWGERMAEDILRLIGFVEGVNYRKQATIEGVGSRPDFVFPLPGGLALNMDVKFPFDNYVRYTEADDEGEKEIHKSAFLKDVNGRIKELTSRDYIDPGQGTVDYVLMFIPNENLYSFVHQSDPSFLDNALRQKVICCSPTTLFAILVVVRQAVDNFALRKSEDEIIGLFGRFSQQWQKFEQSLDTLGRRMVSAQNAFDSVVGPRKNQLERPLRQIEALRNEKGLPIAPVPELPEVMALEEASAPEDETES
jgi:DNA recombination protein RmuC